eukprot:gene15840-11338_t
MGLALNRLAKEDPSFRFSCDEETGQTTIEGMGELHLEIIVDRMTREFKVEANVGEPPAEVAYREAITQPAAVRYTHRKQSGGAGQFAKVKIAFEPLEDMHPTLQRSDTIEWAPQGQTTRSRKNLANAGLGLVKYFASGFPCLPQSSPAAYGTVRSLFEDTSIDSQVLAMLQESQVQPPPPQEEATVLGPDTSLPFENRLRSLATLIGARMFHARPDDVGGRVEAETAEWMELGGPPPAPLPITGRKRRVEDKEETNCRQPR